jgi:glycosyltransferase involved in cell wall biosynthesis
MGMLRSQASRTKADQWLEIHSAMPRHRLWDLLEQCDVGLALFPHKTGNINLDHLVGASNKVFDYLACGLALLVSDLPEWRDTYVSPGYARACNPDDPASIATALRWFLDHPDETRAMGRRGRQRIVDGWNYESQFGPLLALLDG